MGNFQKLKVWLKAKELSIKIYKISIDNQNICKDYRFKNQLTSSSLSIVSNIAEGDELMSQKQSIKFFYIAKGSCAELKTQLIIASEIGYLEKELANELINDCSLISVMLHRLISSRSNV